MTYLAQKPATPLVNRERLLITIEFTPEIHPKETKYSYEQPQIVFGDRVTLRNEYPQTEYVVKGMDLVESRDSSGQLLFQPYWVCRITNGEISYWKKLSALIRLDSSGAVATVATLTPERTCTNCSHFEDYNERSGRGWCNCFNHFSRTHHQMVDDCILNGSLDIPEDANSTEVIELDRDGYPIKADSSSSFQVGSIVKIIDEEEHHTEWAVFEVIECKYNQYIHDSHKPEAYRNHVDWYYRLASNNDGCTLGKLLWVTENEICHFEQSHQICTLDIF